jgi:hypothetical protein
MSRSRRPHAQRLLAVWLTLVSLVAALLAPGIAQALASANGDASPWSLVCPATASSHPDDSGAPDGAAAHSFEHCPFCSLRGAHFGPPPTPTLVAPVQPQRLDRQLPTPVAPHSLFAGCTAQPRAPPPTA